MSKAELRRFLDIITGRQKEDVFARLTKAASPKAVDEQSTVSKLPSVTDHSVGGRRGSRNLLPKSQFKVVGNNETHAAGIHSNR